MIYTILATAFVFSGVDGHACDFYGHPSRNSEKQPPRAVYESPFAIFDQSLYCDEELESLYDQKAFEYLLNRPEAENIESDRQRANLLNSNQHLKIFSQAINDRDVIKAIKSARDSIPVMGSLSILMASITNV